ncbi:MAG TPA: hypothetical protein VH087_03460 [Thermoanaerobaculia bacterium]|nr:hypothetical protein [Thermoanaerobaculia bacterium]
MAVALVPAAFAQRGEAPVRHGPGTGNPDIQLVPWKYLQSDTLIHDGPVTLYWLPANQGQVTQSPLLDDKALLSAATRCVGFEIVMPERTTVIQNLGETGKLPAVLILDRQGKTLRKFENPNGELLTKNVELLLSSELDSRDQGMFRSMIAANQEATAGRTKNAIDLYKEIWDDRCLYPLAANDAKKALAELGVNVQEPPKPSQTTTAK